MRLSMDLADRHNRTAARTTGGRIIRSRNWGKGGASFAPVERGGIVGLLKAAVPSHGAVEFLERGEEMAVGQVSLRRPAVAGTFYPAHPLQLKTAVERFLVRTTDPVTVTALIVPHAGYIYSGATAGKTYASADLPRRLFILCPNHTGMGSPLSCWSRGAWVTPLGEAPVDEELAALLMASAPLVHHDELAHRGEHAVEVQLPFLQVYLGSFSFVPVVVGTQDFEQLEALGRGLAAAIRALPSSAAIIVSSDMNHYESASVNRQKDEQALNAILRLDPAALYRVVHQRHITMCGYAPAVSALAAARLLGADRAEVVDYTHSGQITGDDAEVVSYAGVRIYKEPA